jgi:hypothetical protein
MSPAVLSADMGICSIPHTSLEYSGQSNVLFAGFLLYLREPLGYPPIYNKSNRPRHKVELSIKGTVQRELGGSKAVTINMSSYKQWSPRKLHKSVLSLSSARLRTCQRRDGASICMCPARSMSALKSGWNSCRWEEKQSIGIHACSIQYLVKGKQDTSQPVISKRLASRMSAVVVLTEGPKGHTHLSLSWTFARCRACRPPPHCRAHS